LKRKSKRIFAGVLAVLVSFAMVGSGLLVFFFDREDQLYGSSASTLAANAAAEYQDQKLRIDAMVKQAEIDPENVPLQTALANEYFNAGFAAREVAPAESQENFKKAVEVYQSVLKLNKEPNIMVNMATAAFYSGNNDLAENTYKEAISLNSESYDALVNYGVFLSLAKNDWAGALAQWQKAQTLAQNSADQDLMKMLISQAQDKLKANSVTP
jgi:tetratricopeptide (TPR) repeat protein